MRKVRFVLILALLAVLALPTFAQDDAVILRYLTSAWWYGVFPGLVIVLTVLGFNFIGDGLRDALQPTQHNR